MSRAAEVVRSVLLREVIEVKFVRGAGVKPDPIRVVTAYYDRDGNKLAEQDPTADRLRDELADIPDPGA